MAAIRDSKFREARQHPSGQRRKSRCLSLVGDTTIVQDLDLSYWPI